MLSSLLILVMAGAVDPNAALSGLAHAALVSIAALLVVAGASA